jgi:sugar lactone lactonase YvrE
VRRAAFAALVVAALPAAAGPSALTVVNPGAAYPEGPSVVDGILYYAEMGSDRVMRFDGTANAPLWSRDGCGPTSVVPAGDGLVVLCHLEEVVARITRDGGLVGIIDRDRDGRSFADPNAATPDGQGGVYFSSSGVFGPGARATGAILHLAADGTLSRVAEGLHYANGVALSPDRRILYASEHLARRVLAFDVAADGGLANRRVFVALDDLEGGDPDRTWEVGPDGLAVDRAGNLIVAEYGAGRLLVVDPAGALLATVPVPLDHVTSSALNADESVLYITAPASLSAPGAAGAVYAIPYPVAR